MHPSYKSNKPSITPDCGMKLARVYAEDIESALSSSLLTQLPTGVVSIDGATQRLVGIKVAPVERGSATRSVRVVGRVVPENTRVYSVNSGLDGFIRETYHDSAGMLVK